MKAHTDPVNTLTDHLFRENSGKMVAALCRMFTVKEMDNVMDIVHDTFETALIQWRYSGVPENPGGWLMQVCKNKAINFYKRNRKVALIASPPFSKDFSDHVESVFMPAEVEDSQLRLLLTCCHPALSRKQQILLTLHILCGFGVDELANGLLMSFEAAKKALFRSKKLLKETGSMIETPSLMRYAKRVQVVHTALYLMFNEGYKSTRASQLINHDLCYEAVRLAKLLLKENVPQNHNTYALLALMFFNISRFPARLTPDGELITLDKQDRKKWDATYIVEGHFYLTKATAGGELSPYHLEAIIASLHCAASNFESTDWAKINFLYDQLEIFQTSPMQRLNAIVAKSYVYGPDNALKALNSLKSDKLLSRHYLLHAVEGNLYERLDKINLAYRSYKKAIAYSRNDQEKRFLEQKIATVNFVRS